MDTNKYSVTFACYNQVEYTKKCIDSLIKSGFDLKRLVIVDNGSTDSTREYLSTLALGGVIFNTDNLGCGVAWNQGALALQAEWSIIMNNDVLVSDGWIERLIEVAEKNALKVISPALVEGDLDYDFDEFSAIASHEMQNTLRMGSMHAVCLAVHRSVWMDIGYFLPSPKLLGYEDALFFQELKRAGIRTGTTGASWLHHFGSITQTAMKQERGLKQLDDLGGRALFCLLRESWLERKINKIKRRSQSRTWKNQELKEHGRTLYGERVQGQFVWL